MQVVSERDRLREELMAMIAEQNIDISVVRQWAIELQCTGLIRHFMFVFHFIYIQLPKMFLTALGVVWGCKLLVG
jgi:hypothetical protein